jgi:hypothetical protein
MSKSQRKYHREQIAKGDQSQACFRPDGSVDPRIKPEVVSESLDTLKVVMCPFCLGKDRLQVFLVSTKKGISRSKAHCPHCNNGMLLHTLLVEWSPESFADFVYGYRKSGYWQKISFADWKQKLEELGWARPFWDHYKEMKAENADEDEGSYSDMMNRQGEQAAQEWNREAPPDA